MTEIQWDKQAEEALSKVPFFVRSMVKKKVTEQVRNSGNDSVTIEDFREAEARFRAFAGNKSEDELKKMMPREYEPGVEMVILESCHNEMSGCPNVLIRTAEWESAIEKWIKESGINERLRDKVKGNRILHHHKLKISISGCPNGCSRPQIADFGIVGFVKPFVDPADCTECGACEDACPDSAIIVDGAPPIFDRKACKGCKKCMKSCPNDCISLSEPAIRLFVGGKLGRRPHLAKFHSEHKSPEELLDTVESLVDNYLRNGKNERFSEFWIRAGKEE